MLSLEIYQEVKRLEIETKRIVNSTFAGEYHSAFKGQGMEFDEVRPYMEGDDIRFIDWNVTAKMNYPYVKVFREERELSVFLLIDLSASMFFGSTSETKRQLLLKISALLALVSMKNNDRVGLIIFTDRVEKVILPKKGRKHVLRLIQDILSSEPKSRKTDLANPLSIIAKLPLKKSILFIISDFKSKKFEKPMDIIAKRHDIVPIVIKDSLEKIFFGDFLVRLKDLETGKNIIMDARKKEIRNAFQQKAIEENEKLRNYFISRDLDFIELLTGEPYINKLVNYFKRRIKRK